MYITKAKKEERKLQKSLAAALGRVKSSKRTEFEMKVEIQDMKASLNPTLTKEEQEKINSEIKGLEHNLSLLEAKNKGIINAFEEERLNFSRKLGNILSHLELIDRRRFVVMKDLTNKYSGIQKKIANTILNQSNNIEEKVNNLIEEKEFSAFITDCRNGIISNPQGMLKGALESFASLKEVSKAVNAIIKKGSPFTDPEFPPNDESIGTPASSTSWARAPAIVGSGICMFYDGIAPDDIVQGGLGDCWFLSTISCIAREPQLIERLFTTKHPNAAGVFEVNLCVGGEFVKIAIDDHFPVNASNKPIYVSSVKPEVWVMILEKAFAKACGSYANIIGGLPDEAFQCLTGYPSSRLKLDEDSWKTLTGAVKKKYLMCTCTNADQHTQVGLVENHAYTLLDCRTVDNIRLVKIRNPWGSGEWNGKYSDNDAFWSNQKMKDEFGYSKSADDGSFFMEFSDYIKYFTSVSICRFDPSFTRTTVAVPTLLYRSDKSYPVIELEVNHDQEDAYFGIHHTRSRFKNGNPKSSILSFVVFKNKQIIGKFEQGRALLSYDSYSSSMVLKAGSYKIVPIIMSKEGSPDKIVVSSHTIGKATMKLKESSSVTLNGKTMTLTDLKKIVE